MESAYSFIHAGASSSFTRFGRLNQNHQRLGPITRAPRVFRLGHFLENVSVSHPPSIFSNLTDKHARTHATEKGDEVRDQHVTFTQSRGAVGACKKHVMRI